MNLELFISKRIIKGGRGTGRFSKPVIRISVLAIALGIMVMIMALSIVSGFQKEIRDKVIGFGSHIQITSHDSRNAYETSPISKNQDFYPHLDTAEGIRHIQIYATKAGIIKTKEEIHGVLLKGVGSDFDWSFFKDKIVEGEAFKVADTAKSNKVLISRKIANKLKFAVGDHLIMYFIQRPPRMRKFEISGIYETGLAQSDDLFVFGDIQHIQKLNDWNEDQISGFEVLIDSYKDLFTMDEFVYNNIGPELNSSNIIDKNSDIFNWLELQDLNVIVIIVLMVIVAGINIISALLILILERTNMIGIMKALGAADWDIQKIFLYNAAYLIGVGLFWGNITGIGLCLLQYHFEFLTLPQESYYVSVVPVQLNYLHIAALNAGTLLICLLMLLLPSLVITKISPVKAIRFD